METFCRKRTGFLCIFFQDVENQKASVKSLHFTFAFFIMRNKIAACDQSFRTGPQDVSCSHLGSISCKHLFHQILLHFLIALRFYFQNDRPGRPAINCDSVFAVYCRQTYESVLRLCSMSLSHLLYLSGHSRISMRYKCAACLQAKACTNAAES